jgi:hypothetical protein
VSATLIGLIVFALVFASALVAMFVRDALPEHHVSADLSISAEAGPGISVE